MPELLIVRLIHLHNRELEGRLVTLEADKARLEGLAQAVNRSLEGLCCDVCLLAERYGDPAAGGTASTAGNADGESLNGQAGDVGDDAFVR